MGLLDIFRRDPTRDWPAHERTNLVINLRALTINGVPFGGTTEALWAFGQPDAARLRRTGHYVYPESGLTVEVKNGYLWWIGCDLADAWGDGLAPATVRITTPHGSHPLRAGLTVAELTELFGEPESAESDTLGLDLCYSGPGYQLEFECSPEGQLRCVSVRRDP